MFFAFVTGLLTTVTVIVVFVGVHSIVVVLLFVSGVDNDASVFVFIDVVVVLVIHNVVLAPVVVGVAGVLVASCCRFWICRRC